MLVLINKEKNQKLSKFLTSEIILDNYKYFYLNGFLIVENIFFKASLYNGKLHSVLNKPALINKKTEDKFYFKNGLLHSFNDNPSVDTKYLKAWHKNGLLHRGHSEPAIISFSSNEYWFNGEVQDEWDFCVEQKNIQNLKININCF